MRVVGAERFLLDIDGSQVQAVRLVIFPLGAQRVPTGAVQGGGRSDPLNTTLFSLAQDVQRCLRAAELSRHARKHTNTATTYSTAPTEACDVKKKIRGL